MPFIPVLLAFVLGAATVAPAFAAGRCEYDATLSDPAELVLTVKARCAGVKALGFALGRGVPAYAVEDRRDGDGGAAVSYRVRLSALAERSGSPDVARRAGSMVVSPIPVWLLQPEDETADVSLRLAQQDGLDAAINLRRDGGRYALSAEDIDYGGYAAFGRFARERVELPGGELEIVHAPGLLAMDAAELKQAVGEAASEVARYYGRFPVARALLFALPGSPRRGIEFGRVRGGGGATLMLRFGALARAGELRREWVLVHELIHLGGPFVIPRGAWLMEGMATYVEPLLRARAGWISPEELWREFAGEMARGFDALTREGLDRVSRRGVYWGGALFMLLADLEIRERTGGRASLETCLGGVLAAGGDTTARWSREQVYRACDAATGSFAMRRLAAEYAEKPGALDLAALWRDLGVGVEDGGVRFDDAAPRAGLRRAITAGPARN
ncbi:MAG: hypothetical protein ACT4N4_03130 [Rhodospirillales bacterium]